MPEITTVLGFGIRLFMAVALGFLIGFERQWTRHTAGILTNVIVSLGAFAFCSFSMIVSGTTDVTRVAAQVVSGIGFLGAGVILRDGLNIRGLNTAATVWATSAVGVLCCLPNPLFAVVVGVTIVIVHLVLHPLSSYITEKRFSVDSADSERMYSISVVCLKDNAPMVREKLMLLIKDEKRILLRNLETNDVDDDSVKIKAFVSSAKAAETVVEKIITQVCICEHVISTGWKMIE